MPRMKTIAKKKNNIEIGKFDRKQIRSENLYGKKINGQHFAILGKLDG